MKKTWYYIVGTILHPIKTFKELAEDPKSFKYTWLAILICGILYQLTLISYLFIDMEPWFPPILKIPDDKFILFIVVSSGPLMLVLYFLSLGSLMVIGRAFGGKNDFNAVVSTTFMGITIPMFLSWLSETGLVVALEIAKLNKPEGLWMIWPMVEYGAVFIWTIVLLAMVSVVIQKLKVWQAIINSFIAVFLFWLIMFVFEF